MSEGSYQLIRRATTDNPSNANKPYGDFYSSPFNHSQSESKMHSANAGNPVQQKKVFGFQIFINNDILAELESVQKWFDSTRKITGTEKIEFNSDLTIPDLNGRNIQIYDKEMQKKFQSCKLLLADVYQKFKKIKKQSFSIIIFVPQGMVSLLIGTKGHQINKIMKQSHTTIVVNQPINRMVYRTVKIQGYYSDVAQACRIIYQILQEKSSIAYSIEKEPSQLDYTKARVKTKFVFTLSVTNFLQGRRKSFLRRVQQETGTIIKFRDDPSQRIYKRDEQLCVLTGKLEEVQAMVVVLLNLVNDYYCADRKNPIDYTLKILIPSNYVTKLIGQKGYMIRDIIQRSGGAQIKILSDKQSERDIRQCIIAVNGTRQNKIDATCLILQQIECFKNGGPILQSGKSINQNLAQQFKNSIPLRKDDPEANTPMQNIAVVNGEATNVTTSDVAYHSPLKLMNMKSQPVPQLSYSEQKSQEGVLDQQTIKQIKEKQTLKKEQTKPQLAQRRSKEIQLQKPRRRSFSSSSSQSRYSGSASRSRSRDRDFRKRRRSGDINQGSRKYSESSSVEFNHDKEFTEVKLVIPKKLAYDHKELKYIEALSKAEIRVLDQKIEGSQQAIISIRGLIKDNSQCIKLLQKRLARMNVTQPSAAR